MLCSVVAQSGTRLGPVVWERGAITRLGRGVDLTGQLDEHAAERTLTFLRELREQLDQTGAYELVCAATSATRDARNGALFVERAAAILGARPHILSGEEEAKATFEGALSSFGDAPPETDLVAFDIGGGSTEIIVGRGDGTLGSATSLDIGSVRLHERLRPEDPPTAVDLERLRATAREAVARHGLSLPSGAPAIGIAGTVTTLWSIANETLYEERAEALITLTRAGLERALEAVSHRSEEERLALVGVTEGRRDVILTGGYLCAALFDELGVHEIWVSDRGVRFGLLAALARQRTQVGACDDEERSPPDDEGPGARRAENRRSFPK